METILNRYTERLSRGVTAVVTNRDIRIHKLLRSNPSNRVLLWINRMIAVITTNKEVSNPGQLAKT